jgi:hypothetical protein
MKKIFSDFLTAVLFILLAFSCFNFVSCTKDDDKGKIPSSVIPDAIREKVENLMPLHTGKKPPEISGEYLVNSAILVGSSLDSDASDINKPDFFSAMYFAIIKLSDGKLTYQDNNSASPNDNINVTVVGEKNNFTAYFIMSSVNEEISSSAKESVIISGTMTSSGISDFRYAFIMLEKTDPQDKLVPTGTYRVFKEGDGLAEKHNWR